MHKTMEFWNKLPKYKRPPCKDFNNFNNAFQDPLAEANYHVLICLFYCLNILEKNLSGKPVTPFICTELKTLMKSDTMW